MADPPPLPPTAPPRTPATAAARERCRWCGAGIADDDVSCSLCGRPRDGRVRPADGAQGAPGPTGDILPRRRRDEAPAPEPRVLGVPRGLAVWIAGAALAPIFGLTPVLKLVGWYLGAFVHEMGHAATAWLLGCPAIPTVSLMGEAATPTFDQRRGLAILMWILLGAAAVVCVRRGRMVTAGICAVAVVAYPFLAFTAWRGFLVAIGGHAGEVAFAALALWRSLTGRDTAHLPERIAYAMTGFWLWGANVLLTYRLATDHDARSLYFENGSYGITNDWIRIAEVYAAEPLATVTWWAVWATLPVPLLVWFTARRATRRDAA